MWYKQDNNVLVWSDLTVNDPKLVPVVVIPLDQWKRLVELAAAWNSGDCCAAIADDMAGIVAKIGVQHER